MFINSKRNLLDFAKIKASIALHIIQVRHSGFNPFRKAGTKKQELLYIRKNN